MQFMAYGHAGIEGTHLAMFEFTQHASVIPKGESVIGTRSDFDPEALAALVIVTKKIKMTLTAKTYTETIIGEANKEFMPGPEVIVRKGNNPSPHTLMLNADKAAADFSRKFIETLKNPETHLVVQVERLE
jgi:hypothetical protein